jgi:tRNA-Thr(GGU) m(6)t(6)A37 methyltransferase TsaA
MKMDQEKREKTMSLMPIGSIVMQNEEGPCILQIDVPFRKGLQGLENFSHVIVFWWADMMDNQDQRKIMTTELPYAEGVDVGVFACRAGYRPNPIAITTVSILSVDHEKGEVVIPWIDAFDGTPLIDLKPYIPICDRIRDVEAAPWISDWPMWMEEAAAYFAEHETDFGE